MAKRSRGSSPRFGPGRWSDAIWTGEIGDRRAGDEVDHADDDIEAVRAESGRLFTHMDGRPYEPGSGTLIRMDHIKRHGDAPDRRQGESGRTVFRGWYVVAGAFSVMLVGFGGAYRNATRSVGE
jgi:hypothetical protein